MESRGLSLCGKVYEICMNILKRAKHLRAPLEILMGNDMAAVSRLSIFPEVIEKLQNNLLYTGQVQILL